MRRPLARPLALAAMGGAATLGAQEAPTAEEAPAPRPAAFGIAAAGVLPAGRMADFSGPGYAITAIARTPVRLRPPRVTWRAELGFAALRGRTVRSASGTMAVTADTRVLSAIFAVELTNRRSLATRGLRPYAIAGIGIYHFAGGGTDDRDGHEVGTPLVEARDATTVGLNAGLGIAFPLGGFAAFVEGRVHDLLDDETRYVAPLTVGLTF